jgi:hypothetical protein
LNGAFALDALFDGTEEIGMVAAHFALVRDPRKSPCARQHREQRHFRQSDGGRAVVDQQNMVGGQGQFIAAAGRRSMDDANVFLPGMLARILDRIARLIRELAKIDLMRVGRAGQHPDVGARAKHARLARTQHDRFDLGMFETQALDGVVEFDVDAEVIGVQLELVALEQTAVFVHVHCQSGDIAFDRDLPMFVLRRIGLEIDEGRAVRQFAPRFRHVAFPSSFAAMNNNALKCSVNETLFKICIFMHILRRCLTSRIGRSRRFNR